MSRQLSSPPTRRARRPLADPARSAGRIALIRQKYRVDGGAERFVGNLLSVLGQRTYEVTLITRQWNDRGNQSVITCNPFSLGRIGRDWSFARAVRRELQRHEFDLVQSHERIAGCDVYRAGDGVHRQWQQERKRVLSPLGRWLLDLSPYHAYLRHAEKALFESPLLRMVICNSRMVAREILDHFTIDAGKLRVVYSGVDVQRFHPDLRAHRSAVRRELGIEDAAPMFLFVGSGFERKGLWQAIEGLAQLPQGHLAVVGKDKQMGRYRRRAARLGLGTRVHLLGVRQDVERYYGAADALVLPTLYDPFPNVALEAMAAALPVLSSTKSGAAELIHEGSNGYVCDALDTDGLARAMECLSDRTNCRRLGAEARRTVEPLTLQSMSHRLMELYRELLDDRT